MLYNCIEAISPGARRGSSWKECTGGEWFTEPPNNNLGAARTWRGLWCQQKNGQRGGNGSKIHDGLIKHISLTCSSAMPTVTRKSSSAWASSSRMRPSYVSGSTGGFSCEESIGNRKWRGDLNKQGRALFASVETCPMGGFEKK